MLTNIESLATKYPEFSTYPDTDEIGQIIDDLWTDADNIPVVANSLEETGFSYELSMPHMHGYSYIQFEPEGMDPFYAYWQPALSQPAPLLVHTPGYGGRITVHPDLVTRGYNVLHVNPLGYGTPTGPDESKKRDRADWPVFADTIFGGFEVGYRKWLLNVMQAVTWAQAQPGVLADRLSFFGTSQGGGGSLILGSIYRDRGVRCLAADEPWLVNFPLYRELLPEWAQGGGSEGRPGLFDRIAAADDPSVLWRGIGIIDALSHVHRLELPVLLTAGGADNTCPAATIRSLYDRLPATKALIHLNDEGHGYTKEFPTLAAAWFRLYA